MTSSRSISAQVEEKRNETPTQFEEAISLTGMSRFHSWLLVVCGLCLTSVMLEVFSTSFLLPSAQCDFQLTSEDKGLLSSICNIGMICGSHLWGFLADTRGRQNIIILTLLLDSLCTIMESFAHAFWLFVALRFFNGFFIVGPAAVVYAYLGEFHSSRTRSKALMWVCVFIGLGICLQPGLAWLVIPHTWTYDLPWCTYKPWRLLVLICAMPGLLTAILMKFTLPESPKFLMVMGQQDEALKVLSHMYSINTGNSPERFPVKSMVLVEESSLITISRSKNPILEVVQHMWVQTKPLFLPPFLFKTLLACIIQYGLYASANGLSLWIPDIFNRLAEHAAMHNNTPCSVCDAYRSPAPVFDLPEVQSAAGNDLDTIYQNSANNTSHPDFNGTKVIFNSDTFLLKCNEKINLACKNSTVLLSMNSNNSSGKIINNPNNLMLNVSMGNSSIVLDFLNTMGSITIHTCDGMKVVCTLDHQNGMEVRSPVCNADVDITAFQNTLIIGAAGAISYILIGLLINYVEKRSILVCSLIAAGAAGALINYVYSELEILFLVGTFVTLSGMCISVVISVVIEMFPTHLRAMATCLSLMIGRLGSVTVNFMLGALLESNCILMIYLLGGISIGCGLFSLLLPRMKND